VFMHTNTSHTGCYLVVNKVEVLSTVRFSDPWLAGGHAGPGAVMQDMSADKFQLQPRG
jgi:hypothetical protein